MSLAPVPRCAALPIGPLQPVSSEFEPRKPKAGRSRFWRLCRIYVRRFHIAIWFLVVAVLACLLYINQIGLPWFLKKPLLNNLRARGVDLQFSRLRWHWYHGIIAENVRFGRADEPLSPRLTLDEVQVRLNYGALFRRHFQIDSLLLRQGRLVWPVADTNQPGRELFVENIQTELRLLPNDEWALDNFRARFAGANIRVSGTVRNASLLRDWKMFHPETPAPAGLLQERLRQLADMVERVQFSTPPELGLDIHGDARDVQSFTIRLLVEAAAAEGPWGIFSKSRLSVRLLSAKTNGLGRAELALRSAAAQMRWGAGTELQFTNLQLSIRAAPVEGETNLVNANLALIAEHVQT